MKRQKINVYYMIQLFNVLKTILDINNHKVINVLVNVKKINFGIIIILI